MTADAMTAGGTLTLRAVGGTSTLAAASEAPSRSRPRTVAFKA